ncbi:MAG: hypothetical protein ACK4TA_24105, partial [Saprospiraceae bacterium]
MAATTQAIFTYYLVLLATFFSPLAAQEIWLLQAPSKDAYFQELRIRQVIQDRQGFIWAASQNGLIKYDGHQFYTYYSDPANPQGLRHNLITDLLEDPE